MDESVRKSCWGLTAWAVAAVACVIVLVLLLGDIDSVKVVATN